MKHRPYLFQIDSKIRKSDLANYSKAVFVLHDQLNLEAWPDWVKEEKPLLIFIESKEKGESLPYHKKKLIYLLSSMRHFALECNEAGYPVFYHSINKHYDSGLDRILNSYQALHITFMTPSEWDSRERLRVVKEKYSKRVDEIPSNFFLADVVQYKEKIKPGYRLEFFYREMRRQTGYLMDGDNPEGGEWNYDDQNREKLPKKVIIPEKELFKLDEITSEVIEFIRNNFKEHFGEIENFNYAVTRKQALFKMNQFIDQCLDQFGPYEDAMAIDEPILFHSQLSMYLNNGLLLPEEICNKAQDAYQNGNARLNSVEGLIRQIIGWREFVRIYYEAMMPKVREVNHFDFTKSLPEMYWTGDTKMHCMSECLKPVIKDGYSHHIPRLMVLSNFSNLTETDPRALNKWFWFAYIDAYEWVVLPNVLGMSTYADGGVLASKPYIAGGNYINKMSDYCKNCSYSIKDKTGENACPFNYLYWNFVDKQRETFSKNGRSNFMVNIFDKKYEEEKTQIRNDSEKFIENINRS
tara:strand:- start:18921 stop:20489 length:1569 start_codon:yes stop_codon:yes gene_type:complete